MKETTTAVALFVKNEFQDIASWIAWHFAIGVDKMFIYDDWSDDGTFDIIKIACESYNIELSRTDKQKTTNFYWRQCDSYKDACEKACSQGFSWIGFLDGDEYVYLEDAASINDFLSCFDNYNAVALNWKIYGSSQRVIKTKIPTYEAFTYHCNLDLGDCELVKSFVRPEMYTYEYTDPHRFKMQEEKYASADGELVSWKGATKRIVWKGAWINHYICRSMEHYIDRIKRRLGADLSNSTGYWDHFNRNDLYFQPRKDFLFKANQNILELRKKSIEYFLRAMNSCVSLDNQSNAKIYMIESFHRHFIGLNVDKEGEVFQGNIEDNKQKLYACIYNEDDTKIFLFSEYLDQISNIPFRIKEEEKYSCIYSYKIIKNDNGTCSFKSISNGKFMTCTPKENGGIVEISRDAAREWEQFTLHEITLPSTCCFFRFPGAVNTYDQFMAYIDSAYGVMTIGDFIFAYNSLSQQDKGRVTSLPYGKCLKWL